MTIFVDIGSDGAGKTVPIDLQELLATRLLVQGNSGSGKSHLLRRLLEESAGMVQQVIIDPEGDFVTLAEPFGHVVIEAVDYSEREIARFAARIREHRASVVLDLEGLELEAQMRCAAAFLSGMFDAPREHWYPALVVVDEAQLFAPAVAGEVSDEARRASLGAMTNLMCRGRKRGLAGVIATQRLAKLAKNVAAEASNFLMGRTFLDIDMARAADLLGMERRQAEAIRDLDRGSFLALGPAITRRPVAVRIGPVRTSARSGSPILTPLPAAGSAEEVKDLLFAPAEDEPAPAPRPPVPAEQLLRGIARAEAAAAAMRADPADPAPDREAADPADCEAAIVRILRAMLAEPEEAARATAILYQDFQLRCRMERLARPPLDLAGFARRLSCARAGIFDDPEAEWGEVLELAGELPEDMLGAFLLIVRAAREGDACPDDAVIAATYGTSSIGRARRLVSYIEARGLIVCRTDLAGKRSIGIPRFGWTTRPAPAGETPPARAERRPARRSEMLF